MVFLRPELDRFYVPFNSISSIYSCFILPCSLTDHSAISLKIKLPSPQKRGSAFWHLNNSLLEDPQLHRYNHPIFGLTGKNEKQKFPQYFVMVGLWKIPYQISLSNVWV